MQPKEPTLDIKIIYINSLYVDLVNYYLETHTHRFKICKTVFCKKIEYGKCIIFIYLFALQSIHLKSLFIFIFINLIIAKNLFYF
jgi:hypothetical protein